MTLILVGYYLENPIFKLIIKMEFVWYLILMQKYSFGADNIDKIFLLNNLFRFCSY